MADIFGRLGIAGVGARSAWCATWTEGWVSCGAAGCTCVKSPCIFRVGQADVCTVACPSVWTEPCCFSFYQTTTWWGCPERAYCSAFLVLRVLQLGQPCGLAAAPQWFCTFCGRHSPTCVCSSTPLSPQFLQAKQHCMQTPQCFAISYSLLVGAPQACAAQWLCTATPGSIFGWRSPVRAV